MGKYSAPNLTAPSMDSVLLLTLLRAVDETDWGMNPSSTSNCYVMWRHCVVKAKVPTVSMMVGLWASLQDP